MLQQLKETKLSPPPTPALTQRCFLYGFRRVQPTSETPTATEPSFRLKLYRYASRETSQPPLAEMFTHTLHTAAGASTSPLTAHRPIRMNKILSCTNLTCSARTCRRASNRDNNLGSFCSRQPHTPEHHSSDFIKVC